LLYADKFRDDRLVETSVCIERILSALRWRADRIRIEGVLTHVHKKGIVPILLDSVNSRHAFTQLLRVAQSVDQGPENDVAERSVRARYRNALQGFYLNERYKITDLHVQSLIARLLPSSTNESS
jgi:hypothetical protein